MKQQKYVCRCGSCVETAIGPTRAQPGSRYSLAFAINVCLDKWLDHIPLERQMRILGRHGVDVSSSTLWDLAYAIAKRLAIVDQAMFEHVKAQPVILETTKLHGIDPMAYLVAAIEAAGRGEALLPVRLQGLTPRGQPGHDGSRRGLTRRRARHRHLEVGICTRPFLNKSLDGVSEAARREGSILVEILHQARRRAACRVVRACSCSDEDCPRSRAHSARHRSENLRATKEPRRRTLHGG